MDGKYVMIHQADEGGASFWQSDRGCDASANVACSTKYHPRLCSYVAIFSATRKIAKGEELIYSYEWRKSLPFPWWLFCPQAIIAATFPDRAQAAARAAALEQLGYTIAHWGYLTSILPHA